MTLVPISPPSVEPIDLATARLQCRITDTVEDALLAVWIAAARRQAEAITHRALVTQSWALLLDEFPAAAAAIALPRAPLATVEEITYVDANGATQTVSNTAYEVDNASAPGQVRPVVGGTWPATQSGKSQAVRVEFTAGYGDEPEDVPAEIRAWLLLTIAYLYEQRSAVDTTGRHAPLPARFHAALLDDFIIYGA